MKVINKQKIGVINAKNALMMSMTNKISQFVFMTTYQQRKLIK